LTAEIWIAAHVQGWGPPTSITPGIDRFAGITGGLLILLAVSWLTAPWSAPVDELAEIHRGSDPDTTCDGSPRSARRKYQARLKDKSSARQSLWRAVPALSADST
jgi:hypothetical protein